MTVIEQLSEKKIVPVVVLDDPAHASPLADAMVTGGLPVAEVTFRTPAAKESIQIMAKRGDILVGAGTVLSVEQVEAAADAGASYIVSPGTNLKVVRRCQELGLAVLPGAVTATEIQTLLDEGIETVKFFPAETSGGAKAIKALSAPFPQLSFVPTGGIGIANLHDYLNIPAVRAVGGSWMVAKNLVNSGDFEQISKLCREAVALAAS